MTTTKRGGKKTTMSGQIVLDYLAKYPEWMPSNTLASLIMKEQNAHFDNHENVRYLIRYYRGKAGDKMAKGKNTQYIEDFKRTGSW